MELIFKYDEVVVEETEGGKVRVSMPLCTRVGKDLKCTGKFEAVYEKVVGPTEVRITYPV